MIRIGYGMIFLTALIAGCATLDAEREQGSDGDASPGPPLASDPQARPVAPQPPSTRPAYNLAGYSPAFKEGYVDGCETAKKTSYGRKNEQRFASDGQYRMGWNDGFSVCRSAR